MLTTRFALITSQSSTPHLRAKQGAVWTFCRWSSFPIISFFIPYALITDMPFNVLASGKHKGLRSESIQRTTCKGVILASVVLSLKLTQYCEPKESLAVGSRLAKVTRRFFTRYSISHHFLSISNKLQKRHYQCLLFQRHPIITSVSLLPCCRDYKAKNKWHVLGLLPSLFMFYKAIIFWLPPLTLLLMLSHYVHHHNQVAHLPALMIMTLYPSLSCTLCMTPRRRTSLHYAVHYNDCSPPVYLEMCVDTTNYPLRAAHLFRFLLLNLL